MRNARGLAGLLSVVLIFGFSAQAGAQQAGGSGPIQVLLVTKGHSFDRAPFFEMFDNMGETITWTHVEHPAAQVFFDPEYAEPYDVFVYYDMAGRGPRDADGNREDIVPSSELQENFASLLRQGKGMVFFHHSIASWVHTWPEYTEVMGAACDWGRDINVRGMEHPPSGYHQDTQQTITVVDSGHPITQGLGESFEIVDESYTCPMFEESVTPLMRTSWEPPDRETHEEHLNPAFEFSDLFAWVKTAENSPIAYIQGGHDRTAWEDEDFLTLMTNAISWAASEEALAWAAENPQTIFE